MLRLEKNEFTSYVFLMLGVSVDQLSTKIGISRHNLHEANILASRLMSIGAWGYVDLMLCLLFITIIHQSYRHRLEGKHDLIFIFPLISGAVRLFIGLMNFTLF